MEAVTIGLKISEILTAVLLAGAIATSGAGCARTASSSEPSAIQKAMGSEPTPPPTSGFLKDYSQLQPGGQGKPSLVYIDSNAQWTSYDKLLIDPVQFWAAPDVSISTEDQQALCSYFYNKTVEDLQKHFTVVDAAGPGVMRLQLAITDATSATPVLRTVTQVVPQARTLNMVQSLASGSYLFVGHAAAEGQVTDSVSGQRLAAFVDEREGGMALKAVATWRWGDAEAVLDFWAEKVTERLLELHDGSTVAEAQQ